MHASTPNRSKLGAWEHVVHAPEQHHRHDKEHTVPSRCVQQHPTDQGKAHGSMLSMRLTEQHTPKQMLAQLCEPFQPRAPFTEHTAPQICLRRHTQHHRSAKYLPDLPLTAAILSHKPWDLSKATPSGAQTCPQPRTPATRKVHEQPHHTECPLKRGRATRLYGGHLTSLLVRAPHSYVSQRWACTNARTYPRRTASSRGRSCCANKKKHSAAFRRNRNRNLCQ